MLGHRELTIDDYLEILRRRYWILVLTAILGAGGAYLFSKSLPNQYQSHAVVLVQEPKVDQTFVTPVVSAQISRRLETMREEILSTAELQPVVEQFHLFETGLSNGSSMARVGRLRKAISVTFGDSPAVTGFTVEVTLNDPHLAQQVCAKITSKFLDQNALWRFQAARDTTDFLSKQIDDAKQSLDRQDARLTAFKLRYLGKLPDEAQTNMEMLQSYNSQLAALTEALNRTQQNKVYLESQLVQQLAAWKATRSGTNQLTLEEQLADLHNKLVMMRARYTDRYPDVIKLKRDIAHLQQEVNAANAANSAAASADPNPNTPAYAEPPQIQQLRQEIHQYNENISEETKEQASLQKKISEYQARVQMSPVIEQQYTEMTRSYQTALEFYRNLLTKKAQADMGAALEQQQQAEDFRVIDPASFSSIPSAPDRPLFAGGGTFGGLCLGIAIALWLELRDKFIRTERDVEFYLQVPTLALVPMADPPVKPRSRDLSALSAGVTAGRRNAAKETPGS